MYWSKSYVFESKEKKNYNNFNETIVEFFLQQFESKQNTSVADCCVMQFLGDASALFQCYTVFLIYK